MRMWMLPPENMCQKHLLGEHVEIHMLAGSLLRGKSIQGFLNKKLLEPSSLQSRHEDLVAEMKHRGYIHKSPLPEIAADILEKFAAYKVDREQAKRDIRERCQECRSRIDKSDKG